jgi:hypothetical protein
VGRVSANDLDRARMPVDSGVGAMRPSLCSGATASSILEASTLPGRGFSRSRPQRRVVASFSKRRCAEDGTVTVSRESVNLDRKNGSAEDGVLIITEAMLLKLVAENAELRIQLAEAQEHCVELAVDAGELHAEIEALRQELAEARAAHRAGSTRARGEDQADDRPVPAATGATRRAGR